MTETITSYLTSKGITFIRRNGELQAQCLFSGCDAHRKRMGESHLYFDEQNGTYFCHKCGEKGNLITLKKHFGDEQIRETTPRTPFDPDQVMTTQQALPDHIKHYLVKRGISPEVIQKRKLGIINLYGKNWITIPIKNEGGEYIYLKLREDPATGKDKRMYPFGEPQLYQWENLEANELYICEGELDEMVLASQGLQAITSTHGAANFKEDWVKILPHAKLVICFDNDKAGMEGRSKLIQLLEKHGFYNIYTIDIPTTIGKDVTDFFHKEKLEAFLALAKPFHAEESVESIPDLAEALEQDQGVTDRFPIGFDVFNKAMGGGVSSGDLLVISGHTGHGKTTYAQTIHYHLSKIGIPGTWFSYEIPLNDLWGKFRDMGMTKETFIGYAPRKLSSGNVAWIKARILEAIKKYNTQIIFIDHLGFLTPDINEGNARDFEQNFSAYLGQLTRQLKSMAMEQKIIIVLLAHTRKTREELGIDDIAHSIGIAQEADFIFMVERLKNKQPLKKWADNASQEGDTYSPFTKISLVKNRRTGQTKFIKAEFIDGKLEDIPPIINEII